MWTWHSKICDTQQSRLCSHDETKKREKGATTGKFVVILQYTCSKTIIELIKYTRVSVFLSSFYVISNKLYSIISIHYSNIPSRVEFVFDYSDFKDLIN